MRKDRTSGVNEELAEARAKASRVSSLLRSLGHQHWTNRRDESGGLAYKSPFLRI